MLSNQSQPPLEWLQEKWQMFVALSALTGIVLHLVMIFLKTASANFPLYIVIVVGGLPVFFQIVIKLFKGNTGADLLAAIALVTAAILQEYLAASLIILMLASGQTLERVARRRASSVLQALVQRMPNKAHRKRGTLLEEVSLENIQIDDEIVIYPHETCPVDGTVIEGNGSMDESYLTGEPYQVAKAPGASVLSGALNGEALLVIKATRLAVDSRFATIVSVLEEAEQKRPSIRRLGDRIGAVFAPVALFFAAAAWYFTGDAVRFLAVLVIATPCPLLIAIPVTIVSAISRAAKQAIVIKDPVVLEELPRCKTAIFDKTGTLTYGKPTLSGIYTVKDYSKEEILYYAGSLERYSKHPLSSAILNAAKLQNIALADAVNVSEKPGQGLEGWINQYTIKVTSRKKLLEVRPQCEALLPPVLRGLECIILIDDEYAATLHFHDAPRVESQSFIGHLMPSHQFNKIMLVSGDRASEVNYLAELIPFTEIYAAQSPEQKLTIVREERKKAPTLFMGDGINDAPALTAATVGIAFGQNSNVTAEAAGAVIMENTLYKVDELLHLSINTRKIATQSAIGGMLLSLIGMAFAAAGFISPVMGAILQEGIDVLAIANALRLAFGESIKIDF
ncbi:heavy metal translocating P-type ATPase [Legionella geestiana]|uniref:heavy metal translocating P-type ATPase n=1 Tax=Legionella geestiana TaxID=45065 RepID=UPI001C9E5475|nr:heavy metal translocating P-type ATPase [Legionella geestiana]